MAKSGGRLAGSISQDANNKPVQGGGSFVVADATGTPQTSPLAFSSSVLTILVPDNAIEFIVNPSTALRVSDTVGMTTYDVVAASTKESLPCLKMQNIYIKQDSAGGTLNFRFTIL